MRNSVRFVLMLCLLALAASVTHAQARRLQPDEPVTGTIVDADYDWLVYRIEANAGDHVKISATSDSDSVLQLTDPDGNQLAYSDDISPDNTNSEIEYVFDAGGEFFLRASTYSPGDVTVLLQELGVAASDTTQTYTGTLSDDPYYVTYELDLKQGEHIEASAVATSGDLDAYLYLYDPAGDLVSENDDADKSTLDSFLAVDITQDGTYLLGITRHGFDEGKSSGDFKLSVTIGQGLPTNVSGNSDLTSFSEQPAPATPPKKAKWTILAYVAADNNIESDLLLDVDEFEQGGGSDETVRVALFLDRSPDYDTSNGNWSDARVFEMGKDSGQADPDDPTMPLIDTPPLFDLGSINSGSGTTLKDFLLWGIKNYPAENYVVVINDHGGGWTGLAGDDQEYSSYISIFEYAEAFKAATEAAGKDRFGLLINDACLMSSVEYLDVVAPYFDYSLGSADITYAPGFDMAELTEGLRRGDDLVSLGTRLVDGYLDAMLHTAPGPTAIESMVDMKKFPAVADAVENFAGLYDRNPQAYADILGQARYNTYAYAADTWLNFLIDGGDLMNQVLYLSRDKDLNTAAKNVIDAMQAATVYTRHGSSVPDTTTAFNISFPSSTDIYEADTSTYDDYTSLTNWQKLLTSYLYGYSPADASRTEAGISPETPTTTDEDEDVLPTSVVPQVTITGIYPSTAISMNAPAIVSMEVVGRNIARGTFTVDEVLVDGTVRRVDTSDIVTFVEVSDGVFDHINDWDSGVNDFDFTWTPELYTLSDGTNTNVELIATYDDENYLTGRYRSTPDEPWTDVRLTFDDDGIATHGTSTGADGQGLAGSFTLVTGGEFQAYDVIVSPEGQTIYQPGNLYTVPKDGLKMGRLDAPSGKYRLGFLIEALGGVTGFGSAAVVVNNDAIEPDFVGYTTVDDGFTVQTRVDWSNMEFYYERNYYRSHDGNGQNFYVYPVSSATDLDSTLQNFLESYSYYNIHTTGEIKHITVSGYDALEFSHAGEFDGTAYTGKAFAVYKPDEDVALVFSAERTDGGDAADLYQTLLSHTTLFDGSAVLAKDKGSWTWDEISPETYFPVPGAWLPGESEDNGRTYNSIPGVDGAFATVRLVDKNTVEDANVMLKALMRAWLDSGYVVDKIETYHGENHTWEVAYYTSGDATGRMYVMMTDAGAYTLWFQAPTDKAEALFAGYFEPMLDGFRLTE